MSAVPMTCAVKRSGVKTLVSTRAPVLVAMEQKLRSPEGRRRYFAAKPVSNQFRIIKRVLGFEQFSLRGLQKVTLEWNLVCVAYNLKRLISSHTLPNKSQKRRKLPNQCRQR